MWTPVDHVSTSWCDTFFQIWIYLGLLIWCGWVWVGVGVHPPGTDTRQGVGELLIIGGVRWYEFKHNRRDVELVCGRNGTAYMLLRNGDIGYSFGRLVARSFSIEVLPQLSLPKIAFLWWSFDLKSSTWDRLHLGQTPLKISIEEKYLTNTFLMAHML